MADLILNPNQYDRILEGILVTLRVLGASFLLGVAISLVVGIARLSERRWIRGLALAYVEMFRGISTIVLLFWMAIAVPILLGIPQRSLLVLAAIALGINMGGYGAEIIRGAILSVPRGQTEASIALNLSAAQRLRHIVLPQALRVILPPMGNLTIEILKGTALVSLVGLSDITFEINKLNTNQAIAEEPVTTAVLYINALVIYFILAQVINAFFRFLERRVERRYEPRRTPPMLEHEAAGVSG